MGCNVHRYYFPSNLVASATNLGSTVTATEIRKHAKYNNLTQEYIFFSAVVETIGLTGRDALSIFHEICSKISRDKDDPRHNNNNNNNNGYF